jgi:hypothetical protein
MKKISTFSLLLLAPWRKPIIYLMKNFLIYSFGLILCLAAGCKKDKQTKVYLLKQQITDDRAEGKPLDTTSYTYDDSNRIIAISDGSHPHQTSYTISYDDAGRVNVAKKFSNSGALIIEFDFYYTPQATGYYFHNATTSLSDTAVFVFNAQKQLTTIQTNHSGRQEFTYDSKGNIATSDAFGADGSNNLFDNISYAYDNSKNPFSQTAPNDYFFMYVAYTDPSTQINNIQVRDGNVYTYTYNADRFPVKAIVNTGTANITITYNYILK